ncbi:MAG: ligand-binding sensor domain-containing protein, partial [Calditrichota bacterium]
EWVPLNDLILLLIDETTNFLWLATRDELLQYDIIGERWRRVERHLWGPGERVVNIGVGGNSIYIETVPDAFYPDFFPPDSPLPNDRWRANVVRYKGLRNVGSFMQDVDPDEPPDVRWRGLRSKVPLQREDLYGMLGIPPVGFPSFLMPSGWVVYPNGTVLDPYLRTFPLTDWITDSYGRLWATYWGGGVLIGDLRMGTAEFYAAGPVGNDVRTIYIDKSAIWTGGNNTGDRRGISRASRNLITWQFFERRDNIRLQSTDVFDILAFDGSMWIATEEGLLEYQKSKDWRQFTVKENFFSDQIRALAATDSELWVGTTRGLCVIKGSSREVWRIENPGIELAGVNDLAVCVDTVYVATSQGLFKGTIPDRQFSFWAMPGGFLNASVPEISVQGSEVWLVTAEGVLCYDQNIGKAKSWRADPWLNSAQPTCIGVAGKFVWVGTRNNGFYRHNRMTGEWIQYTTNDGLLDNRVQTIRRDGDDLLIGTPSGLTRFYWNRPDRTK